MSTEPYKILREAVKAVPAVRYALAVAGIGAVVAIVAGFEIDLRIAVFGTIIVLGLMFIVLAFATLARSPNRIVQLPAVILTWSFTVLVVIASFFLLTGFFFGWPRPLGDYLPQMRARIAITAIPKSGGGPDTRGMITGKIEGVSVPQQYKVVIYALSDDKWFIQPTDEAHLTAIDSDGSWTNWTHLGTAYAAFVVRSESADNLPLITEALPIAGDGVIAFTTSEAQDSSQAERR